jgi:hypothetical protein
VGDLPNLVSGGDRRWLKVLGVLLFILFDFGFWSNNFDFFLGFFFGFNIEAREFKESLGILKIHRATRIQLVFVALFLSGLKFIVLFSVAELLSISVVLDGVFELRILKVANLNKGLIGL